MEDVIKVIDEICNDEIIKVVISNKKNKEFKYNKVGIQLKEKNKKEYYQIEKFTDKQVFHENIEIDELKDKIGIKKTIRDYGVEEEKFLATLDEMSEMAFDDQCTGSNPRYPLISEIKEMYLKAYYG